jgi:transposase-like protein
MTDHEEEPPVFEPRYRLTEVAKRVGYSPETLRKLVNAGTLRTEQHGRRAHHFVTESEVRRALRKGNNAQEHES